MAKEDLFEPIIEPKVISLDLIDSRKLKLRSQAYRNDYDFTVVSAKNTVEWVLGEGLTEKRVKEIIADETRQVEVNLVDFKKS